MKKIFGNLFGLLGAVFSTLLILFGEGEVSISSEYLDIKLTQEVDLYDILFTIKDSAPFKIPVLVGLILTIAAVVFFFLAILISLPKKTGKGVMGVLGIISLIVSSILLMTSFFWKDIDSGITITLSALGIGGAEFIITWLVTGAKISFDN